MLRLDSNQFENKKMEGHYSTYIASAESKFYTTEFGIVLERNNPNTKEIEHHLLNQTDFQFLCKITCG